MENNKGNYDDMREENDYTPYLERPETYIVPILFLLIFIVGVLGNGTLVIIFLRHKAMRNVPNIYIFSLALADLLVIITCVPFTSILYTVESWPWGVVVCKLSETAKNISIGVSVFTLTALSAERYCAIVNPLRRIQTKPLTAVSAVMIWILATGFAIPDAIFSRLKDAPVDINKTIIFCYPFPSFPDNATETMYKQYNVVSKSLIYYLVPLTIIAFFYVLMAIRLHNSANDIPGEGRSTHGSAQVKSRKHVARMVLIFVFLFFICFLPHHVFMLWFHLTPSAEDDYNEWWHVMRILGFCLSFLNSCVNPVALYCVSGVFRAYFNRYLCCIKPKWPRPGLLSETRGSTFNSMSQRHTKFSVVSDPTSENREIRNQSECNETLPTCRPPIQNLV